MKRYFIQFETTSGREYSGNIFTSESPSEIESEICSRYLIHVDAPLTIQDTTGFDLAEQRTFNGDLKY